MFSEFDRLAMTRALALAERGIETTHPNPRVGCVIAKGDRIIAEGWHEKAGEAHAEVAALRAAKEPVAGATAYVTLEPCSHHGRTPPCVNALIEAKLARVVFAVQDPNPRVSGQGADALLRAGIAVEAGLMEAEATELNIGFMKRMRDGLPWVRVKLAMSLDGRTALSNGASQWITSEASRADVQRWRARSSAIMTGVGTLIADDPLLNVRLPAFKGKQPVRVVLDARLISPPGSKVFTEGGEVIIFCAGPPAPAVPKLASVADPSSLAGDMAALIKDFESSPTSVSAAEPVRPATGSAVGGTSAHTGLAVASSTSAASTGPAGPAGSATGAAVAASAAGSLSAAVDAASTANSTPHVPAGEAVATTAVGSPPPTPASAARASAPAPAEPGASGPATSSSASPPAAQASTGPVSGPSAASSSPTTPTSGPAKPAKPAAKADSPAAFEARRAALLAKGARIEEVAADAGYLDMFAILKRLGDLEVSEVLVESGATLAGQLLTTFFVDELLLYIAPKILGPQGQPLVNVPELQSLQDAWGFSLFDAKRFGDDLRLRLRPK